MRENLLTGLELKLDTMEQKISRLERNLEELTNLNVNVPMKSIDDTSVPTYSNYNDAGADIRASETVIIGMGERKLIPTGLRVAIPEGYELQIRPRSGISSKVSLAIPNSPGTIDSGYRDEIKVIVHNNASSLDHVSTKHDNYDCLTRINGEEYVGPELNRIDTPAPGSIIIVKGDRIAQMVLSKVYHAVFVPVKEDLNDIGVNRNSGFGGTGIE